MIEKIAGEVLPFLSRKISQTKTSDIHPLYILYGRTHNVDCGCPLFFLTADDMYGAQQNRLQLYAMLYLQFV